MSEFISPKALYLTYVSLLPVPAPPPTPLSVFIQTRNDSASDSKNLSEAKLLSLLSSVNYHPFGFVYFWEG